VQGITGKVGVGFAQRLLLDASPVVGGVTPGKGGTRVAQLPVFDTVYEAKSELGATASLITVPPMRVRDAVIEAVDAGIRLLVVYTENTPIHDAIEACEYARRHGVTLLGPNSAGCISPRSANLSDLSDSNLNPGGVGVVSKSGTMTYEAIDGLQRAGLGVSTVVCLGGDPVIGTHYAEVLERFEDDSRTSAVVMLGEIGGQAEIRAAGMIANMSTPVIAYIAGRWAPRQKRMGHAGAIVQRGTDTAAAKIETLRAAGAHIANQVTHIGYVTARTLAG
jgi:succinyl-CoA synthetase alpha subunit